MGVVPGSVLQHVRAMSYRVRTTNEVSIPKPIIKHRFDCGDLVFEDVFVGDVVATERRNQTAFDVGSRGLFTGSDGHHDRPIFGVNDRQTPSLLTRNDFGDGPRIRALSMVQSTE